MTTISSRDRWYGCLCYLSFGVLIPIVMARPKSEFLAEHCRQGFALCFAEAVALIALAVFDATIGVIPVLGFLISLLLHLVVVVAALGLSVLGFVRALAGETWTIPYLDDIAAKVPVTADPE